MYKLHVLTDSDRGGFQVQREDRVGRGGRRYRITEEMLSALAASNFTAVGMASALGVSEPTVRRRLAYVMTIIMMSCITFHRRHLFFSNVFSQRKAALLNSK